VDGTLFVVATPIGNLEDITLRALRVLREVDIVAAEDTRHTGNLLRHFEITAPLLSLHEHNEAARIPRIIQELRSGRSVALVSDAGTPGISDPGATVVRAVREAGLPVIPVPGPSAVAAAISVAGLTEGRFAFGEFPPVRSKDRKSWFAWLGGQREINVVFYEGPHRVRRTLEDLLPILGNRPIIVGREVTKIHEEWRVGTPQVLLSYYKEPQGEFVFVIPADQASVATVETPSDQDVLQLFGLMTNINSLGRREVVREVAESLGMSTKAVYDAIERAKLSGQ
jgi:16S rRNA (cytidine1402-2'-O)-methyltransferase